jgi:hypothetical protein
MKVKSVFLRSATVLLAFAAGMYAIGLEAQSNHKTLTGVISDSMCGATHMIKDKSAAECTRMCGKDGQSYSLLVGKDVYTLAGHQTDLDQLAGQTVTVTGKLNGNTFVVESVIPVKK